jgi:allantoinase
MLDLRLLGGRVAGEGESLRLDVGIADGQIVEVGPHGTVGAARRELDLTGKVVLPGVVDVHFHCRAPANPERGDFASETAAAVAGGVTTVFEMPITLPACSTPEVLNARRELIEAQAYNNVALYSGAVLRGPDQTEAMAAAGAIGFKMFTISPASGREAEFAGLWTVDEFEMYESLQAIKPTGLRCVIHAENESLIRHFARTAVDEIAPRPPVVEAVAISVLATLAASVGTPVHIAHVTSREALDALTGALAAGAPVTAETCPQYLTLDTGTVQHHGAIAKVGPPLRDPQHHASLWTAVADGRLSVVASDHSPFRLQDKTGMPFGRAAMGLPTVELLVPVVLDAVSRGVLSLERAVSLLCGNPARLFGLHPAKGTIAVGSDADVTVVDLDQTFQPSPATMRSRAADLATAYAGLKLGARVVTTIVGGQIVYAEQRICADPAGRFVPGARYAPVRRSS